MHGSLKGIREQRGDVLSGLVFIYLLLLSGTLLEAQHQESSPRDEDEKTPVMEGVESETGSSDARSGIVPLDQVKLNETIRVRHRNGSQFTGKPKEITEDRLELRISGGTITLSRDEIQKVILLQESPQAKRDDQELQAPNQNSLSDSSSPSNEGRDVKKGAKTQRKDVEGGRSITGKNRTKGKEKNAKNEGETPTDKQLLETFPEKKWPKKRYLRLETKNSDHLNGLERKFVRNWKRIKQIRKRRQSKMFKRLLKQFPPEEGWGKKRYQTLKNKKSLLGEGEKPARTRKERQFLDVFDQWQKAYEMFGKNMGKDSDSPSSKNQEREGRQ